MLLRLVIPEMKKITGILHSLQFRGDAMEMTDVYFSSLIDTWLLLRDN